MCTTSRKFHTYIDTADSSLIGETLFSHVVYFVPFKKQAQILINYNN